MSFEFARSTAAILALAGVAIIVLCSLGVVVGEVFDRLHYLGPATVLAPWLIAAGVVSHFSSAESVVKAILLALVVMLSSPVLSHAIGKIVYERHQETAKRKYKKA